MEIIPAIIPTSADHLRASLEILDGAAPAIQIDFVDGKYAPSASWPYINGAGMDTDALALIKKTAAIHTIEADLMVEDPETIVPSLIEAGVARIVIHLASTGRLDEILAHKSGILIGVALERTDTLAEIAPYAASIDFIQCMGIKEIGAQGQPFDDRVLAQIREVRAQFPNLLVSVDGGVSMYTLPLLKDAGATHFVAGSAIWHAPEPMSAYTELVRLAQA
jgi:ribulose-phosphate 3-epimerase